MLISTERYGRLVLCENPQTIKKEITYVLLDLLPKTENLSTRSAMVISNALDFASYFGEETFTVFGKELMIVINPELFPMNDHSFFYLSYRHPISPTVINKKLYFNSDTLVIQADSIFRVDGNALKEPGSASDMKLFYYNQQTTQSWLMAEPDILFLSSEALRKSAKDIAGMVGWETHKTNEDYQAIRNSIMILVHVPGPSNIEQWLAKDLQIGHSTQ